MAYIDENAKIKRLVDYKSSTLLPKTSVDALGIKGSDASGGTAISQALLAAGTGITSPGGFSMITLKASDGGSPVVGLVGIPDGLKNYILTNGGFATADDVVNGVLGKSELSFTRLSYNKSSTFVLDYAVTSNGIINLSSDVPQTTYFSISNLPTKDCIGRILVKQSGGKTLILEDSYVQEISIPQQPGTECMLTYASIKGVVYMYSDGIISDVAYAGPAAITDLSVDSFNGKTLSVKWTEPLAGAPDGSQDVTGYDVRYSNSRVSDPATSAWLGSVKVASPALVGPNVENSLTFKDFHSGTDYYVYIRTYKTYRNVNYLSPLSNEIHVVTDSYEDATSDTPMLLPLSKRTSYGKLSVYTRTNDVENGIGNLYDKEPKSVSDTDPRPDTKVACSTATYWEPEKYNTNGLPYYVIFDLGQSCTLDSIYFYTKEKGFYNLYGADGYYADWTYLGKIDITYNSWAKIDLSTLNPRNFQVIKMACESHYYAGSNAQAEGERCHSKTKEFEMLYNGSYFGVFGAPTTEVPLELLPPARNYTPRNTVSEVVQVNGHFYQDGRIHHMVGGSHPRLFGSFGYFSANGSDMNYQKYPTVADYKFLLNRNSWVSGNCSHPAWNLTDLLANSYKPYGMKPILTNSSFGGDMRRKTYTGEGAARVFKPVGDSKYMDSNVVPLDPDSEHTYAMSYPAMPVKGVNGIRALLDESENPLNYKILSKLGYCLAARYGATVLPDALSSALPVELSWSKEDTSTGLDLLTGVEFGNEDDYTWGGSETNAWEAYQQPQEASSILSAVYDGHGKRIEDENGSGTYFGMKNADPGMMVVNAGLSTSDFAYLEEIGRYAKQTRKDDVMPLDAMSFHMYSSTTGATQESATDKAHAIPYDMNDKAIRILGDIIDMRNRHFPSKQLWLTEFGLGETGGLDTTSQYQCYSMTGYYNEGVLVPDRHRSDVKGAWIVRTFIDYAVRGLNSLFYYSTECEKNWFTEGQYGNVGYSMFAWDECTDDTPGAHVAYVQPYETTFDRVHFAGMGLFGQLLGNGGYPISRAYWQVATFKNRLGDYVPLGFKAVDGYDDLMVACFKHKTEDKGAVVVYIKGNSNSSYLNVSVPVPSQTCTHIRQYVPKLPNPKDVPYAYGFGLDLARTGLPTSVRTYASDGTVNGATFPSAEDNPYFPIVGPVESFGITAHFAGASSATQYVQANQYINNATDKVIAAYAPLAWRQVDAVCDYIQFHPEGIKGANGIEEAATVSSDGKLQIPLVTEFPEIYMFDGVLTPDFDSSISYLGAKSVSTSEIDLYFNNTNPDDYQYDVYVSQSPAAGFSKSRTVGISAVNKIEMTGLSQGTTYYFKLQPVREDGAVGLMSDYTSARTYAYYAPPSSVTASDVTMDTLTLSFTAESASSSTATFKAYKIRRTDYLGSAKYFYVTDKAVTEYKDSGLLSGRTYQYEVQVTMGDGASDFSNPLSVTMKTPEQMQPVITSVVAASPVTNPESATVAYTGVAYKYSSDDGATWSALPSTNVISIALENKQGDQTFQIRVRNDYAVSAAYQLTVTYNPPVFEFTGLSIEGGAATTSASSVSLAFSYAGTDVAAYYRVAQTSADLESAAWLDYVSPANYAHGLTANATLTVYAQLKSNNANVSEARSSSIAYVVPEKRTAYIKNTGYIDINTSSYGLFDLTELKASVVFPGGSMKNNQGDATTFFYDQSGTKMGEVHSATSAVAPSGYTLSSNTLSNITYPGDTACFFHNALLYKQFLYPKTPTSTVLYAYGYVITALDAGTYRLYIWDRGYAERLYSKGIWIVNGTSYESRGRTEALGANDGAVGVEPEYFTVPVSLTVTGPSDSITVFSAVESYEAGGASNNAPMFGGMKLVKES